ncbi:MAG: hypothetical protein WAU68_11295 [Vitreimonas sp.]
MTQTANPPRINVGASLVRMTIGAALGGGALYLYMTHAAEIRWADGVAIAVSLICFIAAVRLFGESLDPKKLAVRMEVEGETTPKEANSARVQAVLLIALGVSIVWPVIATLNGWPAPVWAYAVTAIFIVIRVGYTLVMWRTTDEFARQRTRQVAWWTYFVSQTALIAYAGAERLGLTPPLTAWDIMVLTTATSIAVAAFIGRAKVAA